MHGGEATQFLKPIQNCTLYVQMCIFWESRVFFFIWFSQESNTHKKIKNYHMKPKDISIILWSYRYRKSDCCSSQYKFSSLVANSAHLSHRTKIPTQKKKIYRTKTFNHSHLLKPKVRFHTSFPRIPDYVHMMNQLEPWKE